MHRDRLTTLATFAGTLALTGLLFLIAPVRDAVSAALGGDLGRMREELDALGAVAALVLVAIALVHVVVPFPAEFPTAAAGFVLGFGPAFPLMVFAWTLSCVAAYGFARVVGPPVLDRLAGRERMEAADRLVERGGASVLLLGRLIPIVPYNLVSFAAGATRVPLARFTWTTAVGVAPLTGLTALLGERLQEPRLDDPVLWAVLGGVVLLVALARPARRRLRHEHGTRP
ncbi:MAG: TVP38/TMEM64 family protein [Solirubrobacteraceae bacterium]